VDRSHESVWSELVEPRRKPCGTRDARAAEIGGNPLSNPKRHSHLNRKTASHSLSLSVASPDTQTGTRKWVRVWLASLLLFPLFAAHAQHDKTQAQTQALMIRNANNSAEVQHSVMRDPSYEIGPDDVIDINVWKEPDVSRTLPVRPDGMISLPLLSDVEAAGLTPTQLAAQITQVLRTFFTDPQVTVMVIAIKSQRIFVLGEVARPGEYSRLPGMTILQALSSTGGFTPFANLKNIYLLREENGKQVKYPFNYKDVINGRKPEENRLLQVGDTIVVP